MNIGAPIDPGPQRHAERESPAFFKDAFDASPYGEKSADNALPGLLERLREALRRLDRPDPSALREDEPMPPHQPGDRSIEELHAALTALQNDFMESLYAALDAARIDTAHKLTLRLDDKARLQVCGPHPDEGLLSALLDARRDLASAFAAIALCSALLRDLRSLQIAVSYAQAPEACMALLAASSRNGYQLSLKGDMNHFYFAR